MKTYWLEKREHRSVTTKGITILESHQWHRRSFEKRVSSVGALGLISPGMFDKSTSGDALSRRRGSSKMSSPTPPGSSGFFSEERRIYSPITFQDVARRSVANSPTKTVEIRGDITLYCNYSFIHSFIFCNLVPGATGGCRLCLVVLRDILSYYRLWRIPNRIKD